MTIEEYAELCKIVLSDLEELETRNLILKNKIESLKRDNNNKSEEIEIPSETNEVVTEDIDEDFQSMLDFYLERYRDLNDMEDINELKAILPRKSNPRYRDILVRLSLESLKEINNIKELLYKESNEEDREISQYYIDIERKKMEYIKDRLQRYETEEVEEIEQNNIIFVPTIGGNIRVIDEIEHIPLEYYNGFKQLFDSIIDGSFKNVKSFNKDGIVKISEVKLFKIRVVFTRLSSNTYAVITAFVKKSDNDKLYRESLVNKIKDYYLMEDKLKNAINNEEFMELNKSYLEQLFNILSLGNNDKSLGSM